MDINLEPIKVRKYKPQKKKVILSAYDRKRKQSPESVYERIHYMWFHFLQLCLELERLGYAVEKKGSDRRVISSTPVRVDRNVYRDWDLDSLEGIKFKQWYKQMGKNLLFTEGGFKHTGKPQYSTLVKKYNVFIEFMKRKTGDYDKDVDTSEKIIKVYQKERFERLQRVDPKTGIPLNRNKLEFKRIIMGDIKDCEQMILSVCEGRFPK